MVDQQRKRVRDRVPYVRGKGLGLDMMGLGLGLDMMGLHMR